MNENMTTENVAWLRRSTENEVLRVTPERLATLTDVGWDMEDLVASDGTVIGATEIDGLALELIEARQTVALLLEQMQVWAKDLRSGKMTATDMARALIDVSYDVRQNLKTETVAR